MKSRLKLTMKLKLLCPLVPTPVLYHTILRFYAVLVNRTLSFGCARQALYH